jgi:hypothetical protein
MTDEKYGPASFAATAFADSPLAGSAVAPITHPHASAVAASVTTHGVPPQSGVNPTTSAADAPPVSDGPIGRTIHGRYRIKRLLGEGGMGGVYEGEHLEIGKRVAIKIVHALHARDPHIAARIKQEARSTGAIESENIVQVFDAGEDVELGIFLVMEMLKGEDLGSLLARVHHVSPLAAASLVVQATQGLSRAHAAGIVHRDLKPANIFLCTRDDGSSLVKLVDFGIAKLVRDANRSNEAPGLTRMGMVIGTPQYMSPEQAQGLLSVDHRTDIYSLGAVLFEAIIGKSPYVEMPTYEQTILQIMTRPAPRISSEMPEVDPDLDQLCADMMAHDPEARPRDMHAVRERLVRIFPELDGGRLPMRSLTGEPGYDQTLSADTTGQLKAQAGAALARAALSGVRPAPGPAPGIAIQSAVALASASAHSGEESVDVAGVPARRRGMAIGVVAVLALAAGVAVVALVKGRAEVLPPPAVGGYGIVQSTIATSAPNSSALLASPPVPAVAQVPVSANATPVAAVSAVAAPAVAKAGHAQGSRSTKGAAVASASAAPASKRDPGDPGDKREPASARPVGGTSESTEF